MAIRGIKPKPAHLKLIQGNPGHRRIAKEPEPTRGIPDMPDELIDEARVEWERVSKELDAIGLLAKIDRGALAAYCQAWGLFVSASSALREMAARDPHTHGLMIKTTNGNVVQNPLVGAVNTAAKSLVRYAAEFGMTASARARIGNYTPDEGKKDPAKKYFED